MAWLLPSILWVGACRPLQDFLQGVWLGHPLHPVMTNLSLGAWSAAVAFDATDIFTARSRQFAPAAELCIGLGVLGGIGAALAGLADWQHTHEDARRLGMVHGVLNTAVLILFSASWLDRRRGRNTRAWALSSIGYALAVSASYLGGELVFRHRVGIDHSDGRLTPRPFVAVLAESELDEDTPTPIECSGVAVVLIRHKGLISALGGDCPHLGAPMAEGWLSRDEFVCPWHGSRFNLQTGAIERGPATAPLTCFERRIREGQIEIRRIPPAEMSFERSHSNRRDDAR
jgi:nitrite reductase/ring-hydroxylating ferredoxin subunit/uncharacterized membrane protein